MQLVKAEEVTERLNKFEEFASFSNLVCWKKEEVNYNIYIFSIQLENEIQLLNINDDLRDFLAIYFQSQTLEKDVERWNIYQLYLVKEPISLDLRLQIEQDKFATRKLVVDNVGKDLNDNEIANIIYANIFDFSINEKKTIKDSLLDNLGEYNHTILSAVEQAKGDIDKLLIQLGDE